MQNDTSDEMPAPTLADMRRLKWFVVAYVVLIVAWLSVSTVTTAAQPAPPAEAKATPDSPGLIIEIV
ncbi:hypothetical protein [Asticcacaulis endophyticus]|uniref:Uncharacterized protein n=1 Tax=Asticcacaulis endophyticus TaxID=1395890 RepID=A0A918UY87_9CAUL|nr:hypothetical protein [Asticcacaulis endophyticus]GGZ43570.1 hypothetical protein GCM10011273_33000 [Asticcacaulis endophyticus]